MTTRQNRKEEVSRIFPEDVRARLIAATATGRSGSIDRIKAIEESIEFARRKCPDLFVMDEST